MSAIEQRLKELKQQEENLKLEQLKIEFLRHIEKSVVDYNQPAFAQVKTAVVELVKNFVAVTVSAIEGGSKPQPPVQPPLNTAGAQTGRVDASKPNESAKPQSAAPEMSVGEKMNFAIDNRHLAGKKVMVANDKNVDINGEVVGLDAPFVLIKTDSGPTIKVPLEKVSLK